MRVYIWGTGHMAADYLRQERGDLREEDIIGFIESEKTKDSFCGKKVYEPDEIIKTEYDYIFVCVNHYGREIYDTCKALRINTDKLILMDNWEWADGSRMNKPFTEPCRKIMECGVDVETQFPRLNAYIKENDTQGKYIVGKRNCLDVTDRNSLIQNDRFQGVEYQTDYFRYRTFEFVANEILKRNVKGSLAELGVFRGTFSKFINAKFPDRRLYLFDTFESFDKEEFRKETEAGRCSDGFFDSFVETSIEDVLAIMEHPEQCVVRKGLFPGTAEGLENETYAFVSMDVDFERSTLEGLRYFYPRLNRGGAMFIHDYNHLQLKGVENAVVSYQNEIGETICKVPIADWGGTLVVVK